MKTCKQPTRPTPTARVGWAVAVPVLALCVEPGTAYAQHGLPYDEVSFFSPTDYGGGDFGVNMQVVDMNGDGFGDLVVSQAIAPVGAVGAAGKILILSGPTLAEVRQVHSQVPTFSANLAKNGFEIADANGDGFLDILAGSPGYDAGGDWQTDIGRAHLFLGPEFTTDIVFDDPEPEPGARFGSDVALGDLDGDGLMEVIVGAPEKSRPWGAATLVNAGQVWVWSGANLAGTPVQLVQPKPQGGGRFGASLTVLDVREQPGVHDVLVAAPGWFLSQVQVWKQGRLYRYAGSSLHFLTALDDPILPLTAYGGYGYFVGQRDVNGDGILDLFVAAFHNQARATIQLGPDYTTSWKAFSNNTSNYAKWATWSDLNRDGFVDVLLYSGSTSVHVWWGPNFTSIETLSPTEFSGAPVGFGNGLGTGDVDGDGYDEIFVRSIAGFSGGMVTKFRRRSLTALSEQLSISAGDTVNFRVDLPPDLAGSSYIALLSLSDPGEGLVLAPGSWLPLFPDGMTWMGMSLLGTPILPNFTGTLDAQGDTVFSLAWPAGKGAGLAGQTLRVTLLTESLSGGPGPGTNSVTVELLP